MRYKEKPESLHTSEVICITLTRGDGRVVAVTSIPHPNRAGTKWTSAGKIAFQIVSWQLHGSASPLNKHRMMSTPETPLSALFIRHEFAIRRVHSLFGIVPLGLYMVVHLTTNASLLNGPETFQRAVYLIHSPGKLLPLIEWGLIFAPLVFHAAIGVWIAKTGTTNSSQYQFTSNRRYTWQRWTGFIALVYLFFHILHLHGWFHAGFG